MSERVIGLLNLPSEELEVEQSASIPQAVIDRLKSQFIEVLEAEHILGCKAGRAWVCNEDGGDAKAILGLFHWYYNLVDRASRDGDGGEDDETLWVQVAAAVGRAPEDFWMQVAKASPPPVGFVEGFIAGALDAWDTVIEQF